MCLQDMAGGNILILMIATCHYIPAPQYPEYNKLLDTNPWRFGHITIVWSQDKKTTMLHHSSQGCCDLEGSNLVTSGSCMLFFIVHL
jgi:hypothetical protein